MKLVLATRNQHKVSELSRMLADLGLELSSCRDFPDVPEVVEDGATLRENAIKKAMEVSRATGLAALADDTGLEVEYLEGAPGVFSARYAGAEATYDDNNRKLLTALAGVPTSGRRAVFRCVVALALPGQEAMTVEGHTDGTILECRRGRGGFGYDPIFLPDGHERSYAEMAGEEKNTVSHRGKAIQRAHELLAVILSPGAR